MDLKARARKLREQADAATAEASARWDDFVQARTALEALEDGVDITAAPEFAAAQAAQETYDAAAEASRSAEREYRAVLELMGDDAPERPVTQVAQREAASPVSIGEQFTGSDVFREVSARIPETAGSKQAIGTTAGVRVASREQIQVQISFAHHRHWLDLFMGWWEYGFRQWRRRAPGDAVLTFLCELGPREYAITGRDGLELSDRWEEAQLLMRLVRALWRRIEQEETAPAAPVCAIPKS